MKHWIHLYDPKALEQLAKKAQRKKLLTVTTDTLWLVSLPVIETYKGGERKLQDTVMISLDGKIEIAREPLSKVLNRVRKRGLTQRQMRDLFKEMTGKQQRRFPIFTLDLLLGTLDGSSSHSCIWFNAMHFSYVEQAESYNASLSLVTMRDDSQWVIPRKPCNLNAYMREIAEKYRVYVLVAAQLLGTCQKTFFIENKFDTPYLRDLYLDMFAQPNKHHPQKFIFVYCKQLLERHGATVILPEKEKREDLSDDED